MGRSLEEIYAEQAAARSQPMNLTAEIGREAEIRAAKAEAAQKAKDEAWAQRRESAPTMQSFDPNTDTDIMGGTYHQEPGRLAAMGRGAMFRAADLTNFAAEKTLGVNVMDEQGIQDAVTQTTGIQPPYERTGKAFQEAGSWMTDAGLISPFIAAGAPAAGLSPALSVLAELGFSGLGGATSSMLSDEQGNPTIPGMVAATALGFPASGAARVARRGIEEARFAMRGVDQVPAAAASYLKELEVSPRAIVRESSDIKRRIPDLPETIERLKWGERLNESIPGDGASTRQLIDTMPDDIGGPWISHMDESISRSDIEYGTQAAKRRAMFIRHVAKEWEKIGGGEDAADYFQFLSKYDEGSSSLKTQERSAWNLVREGESPTFDISDIQDEIRKVTSGIKYTEDKKAIPSVFRDWLNPKIFGTPEKELSSTISLNELQEARSIMLGIVRDSKMAGATSVDRRSAALVTPILEKINAKVDGWAAVDETGKSLEYLRAKALTRSNKDLYDLDSPVIRVLEQGGQERNLFTAMRNAKGKVGNRMSPASEAERLMRIADQTPGGVENLQRMAVEDLWNASGGFSASGARSPIKILQKNEEAYRVVLGDQYDRAMELLEMSQIATRGKAGTANQAMSVGSGVSPAQFLFGIAEMATNPVGVVGDVAATIKEAGVAKDLLMQQRIMRKALEDPSFMRILLEMPTDVAVPAWKVRWTQLVKQAGADTGRQGVRSAAQELTDGD